MTIKKIVERAKAVADLRDLDNPDDADEVYSILFPHVKKLKKQSSPDSDTRFTGLFLLAKSLVSSRNPDSFCQAEEYLDACAGLADSKELKLELSELFLEMSLVVGEEGYDPDDFLGDRYRKKASSFAQKVLGKRPGDSATPT